MNPLIRRLWALASALLLAACASKEALPQYYVLTPPRAANRGTPHGIRVFIRAVTVPGYLNTGKLVSRRGESMIEYAPTARWAEGLSEGIRRGVAASLSHQRGIGSVTVAPYGIPPPRDYDVKIDVERFEGDDAGEAVVALKWTLFRPESAEPVVSRSSRQVRTGWKYGDYAAMATLLSEDLAAVGEEIGRALKQ